MIVIKQVEKNENESNFIFLKNESNLKKFFFLSEIVGLGSQKTTNLDESYFVG